MTGGACARCQRRLPKDPDTQKNRFKVGPVHWLILLAAFPVTRLIQALPPLGAGDCLRVKASGLHLLLEALQKQPLLLALVPERVYDMAQQSTLPGLALLQHRASQWCCAAALLMGGRFGAKPALLFYDCC